MDKNFITMSEFKSRFLSGGNIYYIKCYIGGYENKIEDGYCINKHKDDTEFFDYIESNINVASEYYILKSEYINILERTESFLVDSKIENLKWLFSQHKEYFDKLILDKLDRHIIESKLQVKLLHGYNSEIFEKQIAEFIDGKNIYNISIATTTTTDLKNPFYMTALIHYTVPRILVYFTTYNDKSLKLKDKVYDPEIKDFLEVVEIVSTEQVNDYKVTNGVILERVMLDDN